MDQLDSQEQLPTPKTLTPTSSSSHPAAVPKLPALPMCGQSTQGGAGLRSPALLVHPPSSPALLSGSGDEGGCDEPRPLLLPTVVLPPALQVAKSGALNGDAGGRSSSVGNLSVTEFGSTSNNDNTTAGAQLPDAVALAPTSPNHIAGTPNSTRARRLSLVGEVSTSSQAISPNQIDEGSQSISNNNYYALGRASSTSSSAAASLFELHGISHQAITHMHPIDAKQYVEQCLQSASPTLEYVTTLALDLVLAYCLARAEGVKQVPSTPAPAALLPQTSSNLGRQSSGASHRAPGSGHYRAYSLRPELLGSCAGEDSLDVLDLVGADELGTSSMSNNGVTASSQTATGATTQRGSIDSQRSSSNVSHRQRRFGEAKSSSTVVDTGLSSPLSTAEGHHASPPQQSSPHGSSSTEERGIAFRPRRPSAGPQTNNNNRASSLEAASFRTDSSLNADSLVRTPREDDVTMAPHEEEETRKPRRDAPPRDEPQEEDARVADDEEMVLHTVPVIEVAPAARSLSGFSDVATRSDLLTAAATSHKDSLVDSTDQQALSKSAISAQEESVSTQEYASVPHQSPQVGPQPPPLGTALDAVSSLHSDGAHFPPPADTTNEDCVDEWSHDSNNTPREDAESPTCPRRQTLTMNPEGATVGCGGGGATNVGDVATLTEVPDRRTSGATEVVLTAGVGEDLSAPYTDGSSKGAGASGGDRHVDASPMGYFDVDPTLKSNCASFRLQGTSMSSAPLSGFIHTGAFTAVSNTDSAAASGQSAGVGSPALSKKALWGGPLGNAETSCNTSTSVQQRLPLHGRRNSHFDEELDIAIPPMDAARVFGPDRRLSVKHSMNIKQYLQQSGGRTLPTSNGAPAAVLLPTTMPHSHASVPQVDADGFDASMTSVGSMRTQQKTVLTKSANVQSDEFGMTTVNDYVICDRIGSGSYGTVFLGQRLSDNEKVAIKCIRRSQLFQRHAAGACASPSLAGSPYASSLAHPHHLFTAGMSHSSQQSTAQHQMSNSRPHHVGPVYNPNSILAARESSNAATQYVTSLTEGGAGRDAEDFIFLDYSILKEVAIMKQVNNKHIVRLYEAILDPEQKLVYLIMQYVGGGCVLQRLPIAVPLSAHSAMANTSATSMSQANNSRQMGSESPDNESINDFASYTSSAASRTANEKGEARLWCAAAARGDVIYHRLQRTQILKYLRQIVSALAYLHAKGILHRDIKPENILVDTSGKQAFLADFGVSEICRDGERGDVGRVLIGTPYYMAPELLIKDSSVHLTGAVDVWALGVTAFAMATGRLPFFGLNNDEVTHRVLHEQPDFRNEVDEDLAALIRAMLRKDPKERIAVDALRGQSHSLARGARGHAGGVCAVPCGRQEHQVDDPSHCNSGAAKDAQRSSAERDQEKDLALVAVIVDEMANLTGSFASPALSFAPPPDSPSSHLTPNPRGRMAANASGECGGEGDDSAASSGHHPFHMLPSPTGSNPLLADMHRHGESESSGEHYSTPVGRAAPSDMSGQCSSTAPTEMSARAAVAQPFDLSDEQVQAAFRILMPQSASVMSMPGSQNMSLCASPQNMLLGLLH